MDEEQVESTEQQTEEKPQYTNKQLNDLLAKNADKELRKRLAEAGFESLDQIKALADAKKAQDDAAKTEAQKLAEERDAEKKRAAELEAGLKTAEAKAAIVEAGLPSKVTKFVLECEGETIEEKIAKFREEYPEFAKAPVQDFGGKTKTTAPDAVTDLLNEARKRNGLPAK